MWPCTAGLVVRGIFSYQGVDVSARKFPKRDAWPLRVSALAAPGPGCGEFVAILEVAGMRHACCSGEGCLQGRPLLNLKGLIGGGLTGGKCRGSGPEPMGRIVGALQMTRLLGKGRDCRCLTERGSIIVTVDWLESTD